MKKIFFVLVIMCSACASTNVFKVEVIRSMPQYKSLNSHDREVAEKIMSKSIKNNKKDYYFSKLYLLFQVETLPTAPISAKNIAEIKSSVAISKSSIKGKKIKDILDYMFEEERYELLHTGTWKTHGAFLGPYFYVINDDPTDILINIKVGFNGHNKLINDIIILEDLIEKHLKIPGFSVNLIFVSSCSNVNDIFYVNVNTNEWPDSKNWVSDHMVLAHELLHLIGLSDEYDWIESHAENKSMSISNRLKWFLAQMDKKLPSDGHKGIMGPYWMKPLERHACVAAKLGKECIEARLKAFH